MTTTAMSSKIPTSTTAWAWDTITWAFTSTEQANWHPLTWLSHALDYSCFTRIPQGITSPAC